MDEGKKIAGKAVRRRFAQGPGSRRFAEGAAGASALGLANDKSAPSAIHIRLFDPGRLFNVIVVLFWPLKFAPILLAPVVLLAALTMYKHWNDITADLERLLGEFSFLIHALLSLFVVNLGVRLAMGAVVRAFGGTVREFGLIFFLGIIPRFYLDRSAIAGLDRRGQLWAYGTPLLVRLGFFAFGMLAWAVLRSNGTWAANLALVISQAGLWSFLFVIMPFVPGDGYNWLAVYFRQPVLRQKAFIALSCKLRGAPLPPVVSGHNVPMLLIFAVGSILALVAVAAVVLSVLAVLLIRTLQGLGAIIFLGCLVSFVVWVLSLRATLQRRRQSRGLRLLQATAPPATEVAEAALDGAPRRVRPWMLWAGGLAAAAIAAAFLPYSYDPAGPFAILPAERSHAVARTDGEVVNVRVHEGEWVKAGQALALLSSADQKRDVALTRAELDGAQTHLAELEGNKSNLDGSAAPNPSADATAIDTAANEVERLRQKLDGDEAQLERTTIRAPAAGFVTTPNPQLLAGTWLNAGEKFLQIDDTRVVEAEIKLPQSNVALVKPGAKVRLRPWSEQDGEIVGRVAEAPLIASAEAERSGTEETALRREEFSRTAITGYGLPATARDRLDDELLNTEEMSPRERALARVAATRQETTADAADGGAARVKVTVPNAATLLRPAMTGYAKISGPEMTLGSAFFRLCVRFFTMELWSFVP